jgi:hypothetical protein
MPLELGTCGPSPCPSHDGEAVINPTHFLISCIKLPLRLGRAHLLLSLLRLGRISQAGVCVCINQQGLASALAVRFVCEFR